MHNFQSFLRPLNLLFSFHSQPLYFILDLPHLKPCYCSILRFGLPIFSPSTFHSITLTSLCLTSDGYTLQTSLWYERLLADCPDPINPVYLHLLELPTPFLQAGWIPLCSLIASLFHLCIFYYSAPALAFSVESRNHPECMSHQEIWYRQLGANRVSGGLDEESRLGLLEHCGGCYQIDLIATIQGSEATAIIAGRINCLSTKKAGGKKHWNVRAGKSHKLISIFCS